VMREDKTRVWPGATPRAEHRIGVSFRRFMIDVGTASRYNVAVYTLENKPMDITSAIHEASSLPIPDRVRFVQAVWDSLPDDVGVSLSQGQIAEITRRLDAHHADPSSAISRDELVARLGNGK